MYWQICLFICFFSKMSTKYLKIPAMNVVAERTWFFVGPVAYFCIRALTSWWAAMRRRAQNKRQENDRERKRGRIQMCMANFDNFFVIEQHIWLSNYFRNVSDLSIHMHQSLWFMKMDVVESVCLWAYIVCVHWQPEFPQCCLFLWDCGFRASVLQ